MSRGTVLGSVLLMITAAMIFAIGAASVGMFNLNFVTATEAQENARNLADAAVNLGIADLLENQAYGTDRMSSETIQVPGPLAGSSGTLCFNVTQAGSLGVLYSTNNLAGTAATGGDGLSVPASTCHLVGLGQVGATRAQVECLFYQPPFPKGMASSGPITADHLVVAGVKDPTLFTGSMSGVPPDQQLPGHIFSNSNANPAVTLGPGCNITGNVGAVGGVQLDPSDTVGGQVRPGAAPQDLPGLDVPGMIARVTAVTGMTTLGSTEPSVNLSLAYAGATGNLEVSGDVNLSAGVLFVGGNLIIDGKVTGTGAILVGGTTNILHGSQLTSGEQVALASQGDVKLVGQGSGYYFHGLVYTQGNLTAQDLDVVGTVVTNSPPGRGAMQLSNVELIQCPVAVTTALGNPIAYQYYHNGQLDGTVNLQAQAYFDPASQQLRYNATGTSWFVQTVGGSAQQVGMTYDQLMQFIYSPSPVPDPNVHPGLNLSQGASGIPVGKWASYAGALAGNQTDPDVLSFNLNSILSASQRSRILWWRRI